MSCTIARAIWTNSGRRDAPRSIENVTSHRWSQRRPVTRMRDASTAIATGRTDFGKLAVSGVPQRGINEAPQEVLVTHARIVVVALTLVAATTPALAQPAAMSPALQNAQQLFTA